MRKNEKEFTPQALKQLFIEEFKDSFNELLNISQEKFFEEYKRRVEAIIEDTFPLFDFTSKENSELLLKENKSIVSDYYLPVKYHCSKALAEYKCLTNPSRREERLLKLFTPHCFHHKTAYHTCQGNFITARDANGVESFVICNKCSACYYVECIKMYCSECECEFLSSSLKDIDFTFAPVTWAKYHCSVALNQQMQCMTCNDFLWLKNDLIYCKKCRTERKAEEIEWKCMICKKSFYTEAKIYNPLEFKNMKLAVKNAIVNKIVIKPVSLPCKCNENALKLTFYHRDNCKGILYSGEICGKKIVVCSECKVFCSLKKYTWNCPLCKEPFKTTNTRIFKREVVKPKPLIFPNEDSSLGNMSPKINSSRKRGMDMGAIIKNLGYFSPQNKREDNEKKANASKFKLNLITVENNLVEEPKIVEDIRIRSPPRTTKNNMIAEQRMKASASPVKIRPKSPKSKNQIDLMNSSNKNSFNNGETRDFFAKKSASIDEDLAPIKEFNVDDYKIVSQIGQGSYGKIFLVEDSKKTCYSLKKLIVCDKEQYLSITREYDIYAKCKHPHILSIYGMSNRKLDDTTYSIYILMEVGLIDWEKEIEQRRLKSHFYSETELINILRQLTSALVYLQRNKVSHRDIKAQNILVFKNRVFKVADFGEARQLSLTDPKLLTLRGTEMYMSPVLFNGLQSRTFDVKHNPYKSDVYSLALCMVYGATLNIKFLMDFRELRDNAKVKKYLGTLLYSRYSSAFIELIYKMMVIQEESRPDFIELEEYLMHIN